MNAVETGRYGCDEFSKERIQGVQNLHPHTAGGSSDLCPECRDLKEKCPEAILLEMMEGLID